MIPLRICLRSAGRFSILSKSHPTQADVVAFRLLYWTGRRIRFEASPALSLLRPADLPFSCVRIFLKPPRILPKLLHRTTAMREMKLQDLKAQTPAERSEERRVGKERRTGWRPKKQNKQ